MIVLKSPYKLSIEASKFRVLYNTGLEIYSREDKQSKLKVLLLYQYQLSTYQPRNLFQKYFKNISTVQKVPRNMQKRSEQMNPRLVATILETYKVCQCLENFTINCSLKNFGKVHGIDCTRKLNTEIPRNSRKGRKNEWDCWNSTNVKTTRQRHEKIPRLDSFAEVGVDSRRKFEGNTRKRRRTEVKIEIGGQVSAIVEREEKRHEARLTADYSIHSRWINALINDPSYYEDGQRSG